MNNLKPVYWYCLAMIISLFCWGLIILWFNALYDYLYK